MTGGDPGARGLGPWARGPKPGDWGRATVPKPSTRAPDKGPGNPPPGAPGPVEQRRIRDHFFGVQPPVEVEVKAGLHSETALGTRLVSNRDEGGVHALRYGVNAARPRLTLGPGQTTKAMTKGRGVGALLGVQRPVSIQVETRVHSEPTLVARRVRLEGFGLDQPHGSVVFGRFAEQRMMMCGTNEECNQRE